MTGSERTTYARLLHKGASDRLAGLFILLNVVADTIVTYIALSLSAHEANPFVVYIIRDYGWPGLIISKVVVMLLLMAFHREMTREIPAVYVVVLILLNLSIVMVVVVNMLIIARLMYF